MIVTYKYRVKDKSQRKALREQAWKVNQIWNAAVAFNRSCRNFYPSRFDLAGYLRHVRREFDVMSDTYDQILRQFTQSRDQHRRIPRFRKSGGSKRSLGWIPFHKRNVKINGATVTYQKRKYHFWKHRELPGPIKTGAFVEDATGRWFVVFTVEVPDREQAPDVSVGIDLGLKDMATLSDGYKIEACRIYRKWEDKLAVAQRAGNKKRVKAIHAKIKNIRKHFNHVESARIARTYRTVIVGNVSSSRLAKTKMAKSVLDAGWHQFKEFLAYKVSRHQGTFKVVNEAYSSQTCSNCGAMPDSRPKGIAGLGIRNWECSECGALHDRDVNAALNILRFGLERQPLAEESPCL